MNKKIKGYKTKISIKTERGSKPALSPTHRVFFNWDIHYCCNYLCTYCFHDIETRKGNFREHAVYLEPRKWVEIWTSIYRKYGECSIEISGGEPSIYPSFFELLSKISLFHLIKFNTNLTFDVLKFINDFSPILKSRGSKAVEVNSSFHPASISFKDFFNKLIILRDNGFNLLVSYVSYPPHMDQMLEIKNRIEQENICCVMQPFRGIYNGRQYPKDYTENERQILEKCSVNTPNKEIFEHHLNSNHKKENKLCRMGQLYAKIMPTGDVFRCCAEGRKIGNIINDKDFSLLEHPEYCDLDCPCWKAMIVGKESNWLHNWTY